MTTSLRSASVGPSGRTIVLILEDQDGALTNVSAVALPSVSFLAGVGSGAAAAAYTDAAGNLAIRVTAGGSNYSGVAAQITGGTGTGAIIGNVDVDASGAVTAVDVADSGSGYWPTISIDGGAPIPLSDPLWGMDSGSPSPTPYLPFVLFPLDGLAEPIAAGSTVTLTIPDNWLTAVAGPLTGVSGASVTNLVGGTFLPPFVAGAKTMRVGAGANSIVNYQVENVYANVLTQATVPNEDGVTGYPTVFPCVAPVVFWQTDDPVTDPLGQPNSAPDGNWTVVWDGDYNANLTLTSLRCSAQALVSDTRGANNVGHTRVYRLTADPTQTHHPGNVNLKFGAAGATNVRVYPPGEATDGSSLFGANLLRHFSGLQCIRYMGVLGTNGSTTVEFSDFSDPAQLTFHAFGFQVGGTVVSLDPYTPTDNWFDQTTATSFIVTFAAPHNARTGQILVFGANLTGPNADGSFPTTSGQSLPAKVVRNRHLPIRVIDATRVAVEPWSSTAHGTLTASVPQPAGATLSARIRTAMPVIDCVKLSNAVGADCWLNVPHAATVDCITQMARVAATTLKPGLKCYLEFSNEQWNTSLAYEQNQYLTQYARNFPGTGATAAATVGANGQLSGLTIQTQGSGYVMAPAVVIDPPPTGTRKATGHCTLINGVLSIVLDGPGQQYDPAHPPAVTLKNKLGTTSAYVYLTSQAHAIFAAEFAAAGRAGDLIRVMGSQYENPGMTQSIAVAASRNGITFDALCVATYWSARFNNPNQDETAFGPAFDRLDADMLHDFTQLGQIYGQYYAPLASHRANLDANGYPGVSLVIYEGGPVRGAPYGTNDITRRSYEWGRHPRMREMMPYFLQRQQDVGVSLYCALEIMGPPGGGLNWPIYTGRLQQAGLGDGSDGLHDNRADSLDLSKAVSVIGHAMKTWGQLVTGGAPAVPARARGLPTARHVGRPWT